MLNEVPHYQRGARPSYNEQMNKSSVALLVTFLAGCGSQGLPGSNGAPCSVTSDGSGGAVVTCPDGTRETVTSGDEGASILTRETPFGPNEACSLGGFFVEAGTDDNGDGALSDGEVDVVISTTCAPQTESPGVDLVGNVVIDEALDLVAFASVRNIVGDLIIRSADIDELDSELLLTVSGTIDVSESPNLNAIRFSRLQELGGLKTENDDVEPAHIARNLRTIELPSLTDLKELSIGSVFDEETIALEVLSLPALTTITGSFRLVGTQLTNLSLPALHAASSILLIKAKTIERIDLGSVAFLGDLVVNNGEVLTEIVGLQNITEIGQLFLQVAAITEINMPAITNIFLLHVQGTNLTSLDGLSSLISADTFTVISNPTLTSFGLDALRVVARDIQVESNPLLLDCHVDALVGQLLAFDGETDIGNNGGVGACP